MYFQSLLRCPCLIYIRWADDWVHSQLFSFCLARHVGVQSHPWNTQSFTDTAGDCWILSWVEVGALCLLRSLLNWTDSVLACSKVSVLWITCCLHLFPVGSCILTASCIDSAPLEVGRQSVSKTKKGLFQAALSLLQLHLWCAGHQGIRTTCPAPRS